MKAKKHRSRNVPNPVARGFASGYEPSFKRTVILYAEQKSNREARKRFGISEETIRRWRKLRKDIMEKAQQSIRRSQRHAVGHGSFSESSPPLLPAKKDKEKEKEKSIEKEKVSREKKEIETDEMCLDSMPLQQRLSQNQNIESPPPVHQPQETVLQSQPISPTKLKVTRQGKPQAPPPRVPTPPPPPPPPEVCLKWDSQHVNMQSAFPSLLTKEQYVDATLVSEGKTLKCHRMILSSCSPYFEDVLSGIGPLQHPVLFMKDVPFWILKALCDFMYAGEVHILQDKLQEFLKVASTLKVKGLTDPPGTIEDSKPAIPAIKQEVESIPPPQILEKPPKEEKEDEPPPPTPKPVKLETAKASKKKEDKKAKHANHTPKEKEKEKEKEKIVEEPPPPKVAAKAPPKIVTKVVLPKVPPPPRTPVRNVVRNVVKPIPKPPASKTSHNLRRSETSRKNDRHKIEVTAQKEKEKVVGSQKEKQEKEKPPLKKDNINDPLDLLRPVYEEIAKEPPQVPKSVSPGKLKERGNVPVKKTVNKKVKKRRYAEYAEDREESPPPVFLSRKGTRSRPNVKIPKFFHTHFDDSPKETTDATIVREPHTDQNDPLIGAEMGEIKAEPLDVEENTIEMEPNIVSVNYMVQDQEMMTQEGEEIIGNYDSPLVNIKREPKGNTPSIFKKEIDEQPVIMDIHTVTETDVSLLNIKEENLEIVGIAKVDPGTDRLEETIIGSNFDTLHSPLEKPSEIIISNVQSMAGEPEETNIKETKGSASEHPLLPIPQPEEILSTLPDREIELPKFKDTQAGNQDSAQSSHEPVDGSVGEFSKSFVSVDDRSLDTTKISSAQTFEEVDQAFSNVSKETGDNLPLSESDPLAPVAAQDNGLGEEHGLDKCQELMETDEGANTRVDIISENPEVDNRMDTDGGNIDSGQGIEVISGSLGSLETRVEALAVDSQSSVQTDNCTAVHEGNLCSSEQKIYSFESSSKDLVSAKNTVSEVTSSNLQESRNNVPEEWQIMDGNVMEDSFSKNATKSPTLCRIELKTFEHCEEVIGPHPLKERMNEVKFVEPTSNSEQTKCKELEISDIKSASTIHLPAPERGLNVERIPDDTSNPDTPHTQAETSQKCNKLNTSSPESKDILSVECFQAIQIIDMTKEDKSLVIDNVTLSASQGASRIRGDEAAEASEEYSNKTSEEIDCAAISEVEFSDTSSQSTLPEIKQGDSLEVEVKPLPEKSDNIISATNAVTLEVDPSSGSSEHLHPENTENVTEQEMHPPGKSNEEVISQSVSLIKDIGSPRRRLISHITALSPVNQVKAADATVTCTVGLEQSGVAKWQAKNTGYEKNVVNVTTTNQPKDAPVSHVTELSVTDGTTQEKSFTENIEAELEKCLASTSDDVSLRSNEGKLKVSVKPLPFEDDEDFTQMEFSSFIGGNRPANYLGDDFGTGFEMNQLDDLKHDTKTNSKEHCPKLDDPVMTSESSIEDQNSAPHIVYALRPETQVDKTYNKSESGDQTRDHAVKRDGGLTSDSKIIVAELQDGKSLRDRENDDELANNLDVLGDVEMKETYVNTPLIDNELESGHDSNKIEYKFETFSVVGDEQNSVIREFVSTESSGMAAKTSAGNHSITPATELQDSHYKPFVPEKSGEHKLADTCLLRTDETIENIQCNEIAPSSLNCCEKPTSAQEERRPIFSQSASVDCIKRESNPEEQSASFKQESVKDSHLERATVVGDTRTTDFRHEEELPTHDGEQSPSDRNDNAMDLSLMNYRPEEESSIKVEKEVACNPTQKPSSESISVDTTEESMSLGVERDFNMTESSTAFRDEQRMELLLCEQSTSGVVDRTNELTPTELPISAEDEKRMEDTLLADLDDDIEMKDVTASKEQDGSERTLEMIVNDLNESLGDVNN